MDRLTIVPWPTKLEPGVGWCELSAASAVDADTRESPTPAMVKAELARVLPKAQGGVAKPIRLAIDASRADEGYTLRVTPDEISIAGGPAGVSRGCQTLIQLVFHQARGASARIPAMIIEDRPRFAWRGLMLDCGRHFFPVDAVLRFIDLLALQKFNIFHWHLTEDQGWRIEIRRYPRLTEIGSRRACTQLGHHDERPRRYDDTPYGGFYTQDEIRRVVAYAAERHITVVPEIDMPGHMQAAIAAYPELGNTGHPVDVRCHWGISQRILNMEESTITFVQNVLEEVLELFPSPFIHLGGDEAVKHEWSESRRMQQRMAELGLTNENELQRWFTVRMARFLADRGRRLIGWDEIMEAGLPEGAAIMSWRGMQHGADAARAGHDVVMAPTSHTYLDFYQADPKLVPQPLAIGGLTPIEKVYVFEPIPDDLPPDRHRHILGTQGQLWTEYIPTEEHLHYMACPRACALAEVAWSAKGDRDWNSFAGRLERHLSLLQTRALRIGPAPASGAAQ